MTSGNDFAQLKWLPAPDFLARKIRCVDSREKPAGALARREKGNRSRVSKDLRESRRGLPALFLSMGATIAARMASDRDLCRKKTGRQEKPDWRFYATLFFGG
jgi:hypothetical protein